MTTNENDDTPERDILHPSSAYQQAIAADNRINAGFRRQLEHLINRYSLENHSNTPDFMLAEFSCDTLAALNKLINARETWYGRVNAGPGQPVENKTNPEDFLVTQAMLDAGIKELLNTTLAIGDKELVKKIYQKMCFVNQPTTTNVLMSERAIVSKRETLIELLEFAKTLPEIAPHQVLDIRELQNTLRQTTDSSKKIVPESASIGYHEQIVNGYRIIQRSAVPIGFFHVELATTIGIGLARRGVDDNHVMFTVLVEDDGHWHILADVDPTISTNWLSELYQTIYRTINWLNLQAISVTHGWELPAPIIKPTAL